jgi:hypothetical protein
MTSTRDHTQFSISVRFGQHTRVCHGDTFIIFTVHHKKRTWRESACCFNGTKASKLSAPFIECRWKIHAPDCPDLTCVFKKTSWLCCPVVKVGTRAK